MNRTFSRFLMIVAVVLTVAGIQLQLHAIPANSRPFVFTQPDGSTITLITYGDEFYNYTTTSDGYTVVKAADGFYYYAGQGAGRFVVSQVRANDPSRRTAAERTAISGVTRGLQNSVAFSLGEQRRSQAGELRAARAEKNRDAAARTAITRSDEVETTDALVLLVNFRDVKYSAANTRQAMDDLLNREGYNANGASGSAHDYYLDNSNGRLDLEFGVYGPYDLDNDMAYYGANDNDEAGNDVRPGEMVIDACRKAEDAGVDFMRYANANGVIDNLMVIYAGKGEADGGDDDTIWPHEWALQYATGSSIVVGGATVNVYACSAELQGNGTLTGIGVICHEFGHVLGLPDFYDTDYEQNGQAFGLDIFSIMASGGYLNNGRTPSALNAVERWICGWMELPLIDQTGDFTLEPLYGDKAYRINTPTTDEFFVFENRNGNNKWDNFLNGVYTGIRGNGRGMLVYHVDRSRNRIAGIVTAATAWNNNTINAYSNHECMRLIKANRNASYADINGFFFPGSSNVTDFTSSSSVSTSGLVSWSGAGTGFDISNIGMEGDNVALTVTSEVSSVTHIDASPGQYDITISWEWPYNGNWTVICTEQGGSVDYGGVASGPSYNIRGLKPNTNYQIGIVSASNPAINASAAVRTNAVDRTKNPTVDMRPRYTTDEYITFRVINMSKDVSSIQWRVNGVISQQSSRKLTAGTHKIEAAVTNTDNTMEYLVKYVTVE